MSTYFALRRKDGVFMPDIKGKNGGTFVDPDQRHTHRGTPRLFARAQDARATLREWVKGTRSLIGDDWGHFETTKIVPVEGRSADDWSVIEVELKEVLDV
jgi:hypothetical protein